LKGKTITATKILTHFGSLRCLKETVYSRFRTKAWEKNLEKEGSDGETKNDGSGRRGLAGDLIFDDGREKKRSGHPLLGKEKKKDRRGYGQK